jgi:hypothetical protein
MCNEALRTKLVWRRIAIGAIALVLVSNIAWAYLFLNALSPTYYELKRDLEPAMTPSWSDLANSDRWRGIVSFIRNWVGSFESDQGMSPDELEMLLELKHLMLPPAVREWYLLSANWSQGGLNIWISPQDLSLSDGVVWILSDTHGVTCWGIRERDLSLEDPPVVSEENVDQSICSSFSEFVAAMVVNDVLFGDESQEPAELNRNPAYVDQMFQFASCYGDFLSDGPLESATVVVFSYPGNGESFGKARNPSGRVLLERLGADVM